MEYMDCGSWAGIYQQALAPTPTRIPEWILQCISVAVLNGLCYLKTQKVIHRDVKPSNILLNSRGDIKLCDFNVSGNLKGSMAATYIGTARYMAPERIGKSVSYDVRVDVWSLGLVLVELGMAQPPYTAAPVAPTTISINNQSGTPTKPTRDFSQTPFVLIHKIKSGPSPSLCEEEGFSHTFCTFVKECLRKDPLDRPKPSQLLTHDYIANAPDVRERLVNWIAEHHLGEKAELGRIP